MRTLVIAAFLIALTACGNGGEARVDDSNCTVLSPFRLQRLSGNLLVSIEVVFCQVEDTFLQDVGITLDETATLEMDDMPAFGGAFATTGYGVHNNVIGGENNGTSLIPIVFHPGILIPKLAPNPPAIGDVGVFVQAPGENNECIDADEKEKMPAPGLPSNLYAFPLVPTGSVDWALCYGIIGDAENTMIDNAIANDAARESYAAPATTIFDGQRAVFTQYSFEGQVSDLNANGLAAVQNFQPQITSVLGGVTLDVKAVISADRRFVRMSLSPTSSAITALAGGPGAIIPATTVQLPVFQQTIVTTTVSAPDGGTVLLGGIKPPGQSPLSKIPYVNRLFRNTGVGAAAESLMLRVTPRIIIQEEEE